MYEVSVGKPASLDPSCKVLEGQTACPFERRYLNFCLNDREYAGYLGAPRVSTHNLERSHMAP